MDYLDGARAGAPTPADGGTGLKLSERLARGMGGRLEVSEGAHFGATVSLSLPAA
jgi:C4-dicarboxylate-specific signal transduction histidine kinase